MPKISPNILPVVFRKIMAKDASSEIFRLYFKAGKMILKTDMKVNGMYLNKVVFNLLNFLKLFKIVFF